MRNARACCASTGRAIFRIDSSHPMRRAAMIVFCICSSKVIHSMPFETTLTPARNELRVLVEATALPFRGDRRRAQDPASTVRQMRARGWVRPHGAPLVRTALRVPAGGEPGDRRPVAVSVRCPRGAQHLEAQETPPIAGADAPRRSTSAPPRHGRVKRSRRARASAGCRLDDQSQRPQDLCCELGDISTGWWLKMAGSARSASMTPDAPEQATGSAMAEYYYRFEEGAGI